MRGRCTTSRDRTAAPRNPGKALTVVCFGRGSGSCGSTAEERAAGRAAAAGPAAPAATLPAAAPSPAARLHWPASEPPAPARVRTPSLLSPAPWPPAPPPAAAAPEGQEGSGARGTMISNRRDAHTTAATCCQQPAGGTLLATAQGCRPTLTACAYVSVHCFAVAWKSAAAPNASPPWVE